MYVGFRLIRKNWKAPQNISYKFPLIKNHLWLLNGEVAQKNLSESFTFRLLCLFVFQEKYSIICTESEKLPFPRFFFCNTARLFVANQSFGPVLLVEQQSA